jgi:hypothetical protein
MLRARMVVSMEKLMGERELRRARAAGWFPRHYFVLVPLGDGQMNGLSSGDQWNGVLNALKTEIRELRDHLQEQGDRQEQGRAQQETQQEKGSASFKKDIAMLEVRMRESIDLQIGKVEDRVVGVEGRLGKMEETLAEILREVKHRRVLEI